MATESIFPIALMIVVTMAALGWYVRGGRARGAQVDEARERREMVRAFGTIVGVFSTGTVITWATVHRTNLPFEGGAYAIGVATAACAVLAFIVVVMRLAVTLHTRPVYRATMVSWGALFAWGLIRITLGVLGLRQLLIMDAGDLISASLGEQVALTIPCVVPAALLALLSRLIFGRRRAAPA